MGLDMKSSRNLFLGACDFLWFAGLIFSPGVALGAGPPDDLHRPWLRRDYGHHEKRLRNLLYTRRDDRGYRSSPETVWRVITDVNNFRFFMPRTLTSMAVPAEKIPLILQRRPSRAEEVEALLGPIPADPAGYRVPGGKYDSYLYKCSWSSPGLAATAGTSLRGSMMRPRQPSIVTTVLGPSSLATCRESSANGFWNHSALLKPRLGIGFLPDPGGAVPRLPGQAGYWQHHAPNH